MSKSLKVSMGQHSDKGRKAINQDFYGVCVPEEPQLSTKGIVAALADGISSSDLSQAASESAVNSFLADYFCTSDAWSVKKSGHAVLAAVNSWLYAQTQQSRFRFDKDRGYVCTFSALIIKSTSAHIFHVGDARVYRLRDGHLEQLTNDHRVWISLEQSYLGRALGVNFHIKIDYQCFHVQKDDIFILATDGVYEFVQPQFIVDTLNQHAGHLQDAAQAIVAEAYDQGSADNLTVQAIRIDQLPEEAGNTHVQRLSELPLPPILEARMIFDGFTILREVHASSRSHVYLARDSDSDSEQVVIIKIPSIDLQGDRAYLERFMMEEWVARRINSPYVLKPCLQKRKRNYLYIVTEYIEGQTLAQWMLDHPKPDLETVRGIIEQIAKGLRAFHRLEMLHQDLRPNNIMIDSTGSVKIIDFGSTQVAGVSEVAVSAGAVSGIPAHPLGTAAYSAPEYFLGESGRPRSDYFSLGVITYQLLAGRLPYGAQVPKCRTRAAQKKLKYQPLPDDERHLPKWVDGAIKKAVHPDPYKRYGELSEYLFDLRNPNHEFIKATGAPLLEQNPVLFWQCVSGVLFLTIGILMLY